MIISNYEEALLRLAWTIDISKGCFKLIFARCKYASLHKQIGKQLKERCSISIQEIDLQPSTQKLYSTIREKVETSPPEALMIYGLESVRKIKELLPSMNQVREEFKLNFPFPLVFWVDDEIEKMLIRLTPDFESWGLTCIFSITSAGGSFDSLEYLNQEAINVASNFTIVDASDFLNELLRPVRNQSDIGLVQELLSDGRNPGLAPDLYAKATLMLGRHYYAYKNFDYSLKYFSDSFDSWKKINNTIDWKLLVLFHIIVCYCQNPLKDSLDEYISEYIVFLCQNLNSDFSTNFVAKLGETLQYLEEWDMLRTIAQSILAKSSDRSTTKYMNRESIQACGFLGEISLIEEDWLEAERNANLALHLVNEFSEKQEISKSLYQLIIARSKAGLNEVDQAIQILEIARIDKNLVCNPLLYSRILEQLSSLYFCQRDYLQAFKLRLKIRSLKQQYHLASFAGPICLYPLQRVDRVDTANWILKESTAQEIRFSSRNRDIEELIELIKRPDKKLIVIRGKPGVGKTSLLQAGLIPTLRQETIDNLEVQIILQQDYDYSNKNFNPLISILTKLKDYSSDNIFSVLIFDELEYLFFYHEECREFFIFLDQCLSIPNTKIVIALRDDYVHYLSDWNRSSTSDMITNKSNNIGNPDNRNFYFDLNNLPSDDSKQVIHRLNEGNRYQLEEPLVNKVVQDLSGGTSVIIPFEFQILLSQIEKKQIYSLEQYNRLVNQFNLNEAKHKLIWEYLEDVINECGKENEEITRSLLTFMTNEYSERPIRNSSMLEELLEVTFDKIEHILYILMKSWILIQSTEFREKRFQLSLDYLPYIINNVPSFKTFELRRTKHELRQSEVEHLSSLAKAEFLLNNQLPALTKAVKAGNLLLRSNIKNGIKNTIVDNLRQVIYDVKELNRLQGHDDGVLDITVCDKTQIIASASIDGTLVLWEFDGRILKSFKGHEDWIHGIAFSLDGTLLASASDDKTISLWHLSLTSSQDDASSREIEVSRISTFRGHRYGVRSVCFTPDGNILASCSDDGSIKLWHIDGTEPRTLEGHSGGVRSICFSPDGQTLASASDDNTIKLWKLDGTLINTANYDEHSNAKQSLANKNAICTVKFSPQGDTLASGSADGTVMLWNLDGSVKEFFNGHRSSVKSVSFNPEGDMLASASADGDLKLWQLDGTEIETFHGHGGGVQGIGFSKDGKKIVSGSSDKTIRIWQIDGISKKTIKGHDDWVWGVAYSKDGKFLASVSADKTVIIWDTQGNLKHRYEGHNHLVRGIEFSPDSKVLATGSADGFVKLWSVDQGRELKTLSGHKSKVWSVRFSPNSDIIASSSHDRTIKIWSLDGRELQSLQGHESPVRCVRFSTDGKLIASGSANGVIKIWDANSGKQIHSYSESNSTIRSMAFNSTSTVLATASADGTVRIWEPDGKLINTLQGHTAGVSSVVFSPDDRIIASGGSDLTVKLWRLDGTLIHTLRGHSDLVLSVSFSSDGMTLASASADKTIKLWQLDQIKPQGSDLEEILKYGYERLGDFLKTNPNVSDDDKNLVNANALLSKFPSHNIHTEHRETQLQLHQMLEKVKKEKQKAEVSEIKAFTSLAEALWLSNDFLGALIQSLKAGKQFRDGNYNEPILGQAITNLLGSIIYRIQERNRLEGHTKYIKCLHFSPKDNILASSSVDGTIIIWDLNGKRLATCYGHQGEVNGVRFHPSRNIIISAGADGSVRIWGLDGQEIYLILHAHEGSINDISIDSKGELFASAGADNKVKVWNFEGTLLKNYEGHSSFINSLDFCPNEDKLISASADKTLKLWSLDGGLLHTFKGHDAEVNSVQFSPNGETIISAGADQNLKLWCINGHLLKTFKGHIGHIKNACFSHDGQKIASAGTDGKVKLWDNDGTEIQNYEVRSGAANYVSFSSDDKKIAVANIDNSITLWDVEEEDIKTFREDASYKLTHVCFSPDNQKMAVSAADGTIKILSFEGIEQKRIKAHGMEINSICFSPNSKELASASGDHYVRVWNVDSGRQSASEIYCGTWVTNVCFSPDGNRILSSSADGVIKYCIIDRSCSVTPEKVCLQLQRFTREIRLLSCSPDGQRIAAFSANDIVTIWDIEGNELRTLEGDVGSFCFSPDSQLIALGMVSGEVQIHHVNSLDKGTSFLRHTAMINSIYFSSDGKKVTSASIDGKVQCANLNGSDLETFRGPSNWLKSIWLNPNGRSISSITTDNTLILWRTNLNFELEYLLNRGFRFVREYVKNNPNVNDIDRALCENL
jgi:WD40 repeat protein